MPALGMANIKMPGSRMRTNRRRPPSRVQTEHCDPLEILEELRGIETQIPGEIDELAEAMEE